jgi:hypothetical protein
MLHSFSESWTRKKSISSFSLPQKHALMIKFMGIFKLHIETTMAIFVMGWIFNTVYIDPFENPKSETLENNLIINYYFLSLF